jgi:hypothetical protein
MHPGASKGKRGARSLTLRRVRRGRRSAPFTNACDRGAALGLSLGKHGRRGGGLGRGGGGGGARVRDDAAAQAASSAGAGADCPLGSGWWA